MNREELLEQVTNEMSNWFGPVAFEKFSEKLSLIVTGSLGWGIEEGSDHLSDIDATILLENEDWNIYRGLSGTTEIIDTKLGNRKLFCQVRPATWLYERFTSSDPEQWPLYLWIYENSVILIDALNIAEYVQLARTGFEKNLHDLVRSHYIKCRVRKYDMQSSYKRELHLASNIYKLEFIRNALRTYMLILNNAYPYSKWLSKAVEMTGNDGAIFVSKCEKLTKVEEDYESLKEASGSIVVHLKEMINRRLNISDDWIESWWNYNLN